MKFIRLLQEASELPLSDLKKAMQKDKRVAPIFKASLSPADIADKAAFLSTLKFFVLNNPNVRAFVGSRHNVKDLWKEDLKDLALLKASDLEGDKAQQKLDELRDFVKRLFREHTHVTGAGMSKDLRDKLDDWFNSSGRRYDMHPTLQRELQSLPGVRSGKKVLLYRGLLFNEWSLQSRERYDGTLEEGNGLKFLKSIRANKRTVDLTWDRPSSWTKSKEIAARFAQYGPASSQFSAMMQWFDRGDKQRAIDGQLGFVISTLADPEDVLLDTDFFNARFHMKHGDEGEVILKPGSYLCRVVRKYTQAGEVEPEAQAAENTELQRALEAVAGLRVPKVAEQLSKTMDDMSWAVDGSDILRREPRAFKELALNSTTTELLHAYDRLRDFFNEHLKDLDKADIRVDGAEANDALRRQIEELKHAYDSMKSSTKSVHLRTEKNPTGRGARHELTGEQLRTAYNGSGAALERDAARNGYLRFMDRDNGRTLKQLASALEVDAPGAPHMLGAVKSKEFLDRLTKAFFDKVGVDQPADTADAVKTMINLLRKVERNKYIFGVVNSLINHFNGAKGEATKDV